MGRKGTEGIIPVKLYFAYGVVTGACLSTIVAMATGRVLAGGLFALLVLVLTLLRNSGERRVKKQRERRVLR